MRASYFTVDDEKIFDLLSCRNISCPSGPDAATLPNGRAYTAAIGLSEFECNAIDEVMRWLEKGLQTNADLGGMAVSIQDCHSIFQVHTHLSILR